MHVKNVIVNALSKKAGLIVSLAIVTIMSSILVLLSPLFFSKLIDDNTLYVVWATLIVVALGLSFTGNIIKKNQGFSLGSYISGNLAKHAYTSVLKVEEAALADYLTDCDMASLPEKIMVNSKKIGEQYISTNLVNFLSDGIFLFCLFIFMLSINPIMCFITVATTPLYVMIKIAIDKVRRTYRQKKEKSAVFGENKMHQAFTNIINVKIKNGIEKEEEDFSNWLNNYERKKIRSLRADMFSNVLIIDFFSTIICSLILVFGLWLLKGVNNFNITNGIIFAYALYIPMCYSAINRMTIYNISKSDIDVSFKILDDIIGLKSENRTEPINSLDETHVIRFKDVFYKGRKGVLKNISFELKKGEKLGILCENITTKKIIFDLFTKIIRPNSGEISINNCDISKLNTYYLRSILSTISCDLTSIEGTVLENVIYPFNMDEYKYNDCLYKSKLKDVITDLGNRKQTMIDELDNDTLQRVAFANAFYKDSKIFLLNDATENLNPKIEEEIMKEIYALKGKMTIIMTSRIYNIFACDKILILDESGVVEYGRTVDLLQDKDSLLVQMTKTTKIGKIKIS